jgi:hypothetical protein
LLVERFHPLPHTAHHCRGRDEGVLRFLLHDLEQRIELVHPLLGEIHRLTQPLVRGVDRLVHPLHVDSHRRRDVVDVVGDRAGVSH